MITKRVLLYACTLLASVATTPSFAICTTDVSGVINGETWTPAGSPYCVIGDITVVGLGLTISGAGVRVQFMGNYAFDVIGVLDAEGTAASPVLFKPDNSNPSGWQGIELDNVPPGNRLVHVRIDGAKNSALRVLNSYPELDHIALINSEAPRGGGLYLELTASSQTLELSNCSVNTNTAKGNASGHGGGIYAIVGRGALRMVNCDVQNNDATRGSTNSSNYGGGIYFEDANDVEIVSSTISDNLAYSSCYSYCGSTGAGGGIYVEGGNLVIEDSEISGNITTASGHHAADYSYGGGIYLNVGNVTLINSLVRHNTSNSADGNEYGGGLYTNDGRFALINSDVADNIPEGIRNGDGLVDAVNCIVWGNQGDQIVDSVGDGAVAVNYSIVEGGWPDGTGNLDCDPRFVTPFDYHLNADSCAIDAGDSTVPGLPATDKDSNPRIQGPAVDMGAYELPGVSLCNGDFDRDGDVDGSDLARFDFGRTDCPIVPPIILPLGK